MRAYLYIAIVSIALSAQAQAQAQARAADDMAQMSGMAHMPGHMYMTTVRPPQPGDRQKADAVVAAARQAMAPYQDYHKALADGFKIFLPDIPQPQYHFTNDANGLASRSQFDPLKPTSLLYVKTGENAYRLVGAMYTARVDATEDEINERPRILGPTRSLGCSARSRPRRRASPPAGSSIRISSAGWCMSTPTKKIRR
jgi:hypothetical protein